MLEVLRSGRLSLGPTRAALRARVRGALGARHASRRLQRHRRRCTSACARVGVERGRRGRHVAVLASSPPPTALLYEGARPVFCDIDPRTLNLDPAAAAAAITERTTALLPVHIFGYPADMPALRGARAERCPDRRGRLRGARRRRTPTARAVGAPRQPAGLRLLRQQAAHHRRGRDARARLGRAQGSASTPSATRAARPTWAGSTTTGSASTTGSTDIAVRARARAARAARRACSPAARAVAALYGEALAGVEGLALPCADAGGDVRGWFVFVVQLPRGVDRDAADRARCASAACTPSPTCRRST